MNDPAQHVGAFFEAHPEIDVLETFIVDINGQLRGKWVPVGGADKVMNGQLRFPKSSFLLDIWGNEVPASGFGAPVGDPDGVCTPVPETLSVVTWTEHPMAQLLLSMHDLDATFMAKPFPKDSGNGLHVHFSVLDENGRNLFALGEGRADGQGENQGESRGDGYGAALRHAMGGLLATMHDAMAVCSVNANSFRRFEAGTFAPIAATWGWDNRNTALRVPDSDTAGTRIEHRVAGADAEPHLVIAAVLAGALHGIEHAVDPGEPVVGNAIPDDATRLPVLWDDALDAFEGSDFIGEFFGEPFRKAFAALKRQEKQKFEAVITTLEYETYLHKI